MKDDGQECYEYEPVSDLEEFGQQESWDDVQAEMASLQDQGEV